MYNVTPKWPSFLFHNDIITVSKGPTEYIVGTDRIISKMMGRIFEFYMSQIRFYGDSKVLNDCKSYYIFISSFFLIPNEN